MTMAGTDKEELLKRIQEQLAYREDSDVIHLLWKGYLVALMELGALSADDYHDLNASLKEVGEEERREMFVGFPGQYE
jgi:hypothetical protein